MERWRHPLHRDTNGRHAHQEPRGQLRARRRVDAREAGRQFGSVRVGAGKVARRPEARPTAAWHRGASARQRLCRAVREGARQKAGLLQHARRRVSCGHV